MSCISTSPQFFLNSKNAQSHLAFHQTPSIWTKKFRISKKFRKVDSALLLLHFSSPLLLLSFCSSMHRGRRRPWSRGGARGARAQEWHSRGGLTLRGAATAGVRRRGRRARGGGVTRAATARGGAATARTTWTAGQGRGDVVGAGARGGDGDDDEEWPSGFGGNGSSWRNFHKCYLI